MGLLGKLTSREARVAIIGLGYVGLPLAIETARAGFLVIGIDADASVVLSLRNGRSHIAGVSDDALSEFVESGRLQVWDSDEFLQALARETADPPDVHVVCVPTPLHAKAVPNLSMMDRAVGMLARVHRARPVAESLVVVESTTYPGMTTERVASILSTMRGSHCLIAYSPERVDPATTTDFREIPKVAGAADSLALEAATAFYEPIFETVLPVASAETAEAIKIFENTFRFVSITFANMFAAQATSTGIDAWGSLREAAQQFGSLAGYVPQLLDVLRADGGRPTFPRIAECFSGRSGDSTACERCPIRDRHLGNGASRRRLRDLVACGESLERCFRCVASLFVEDCLEYLDVAGIDSIEVLAGIATKPFGLGIGLPGPGIGGHCIPIDPLYLLWQAERIGTTLAVISECHEFNEYEMPRLAVQFAERAIRERGFSGRVAVVLLGISYKKNTPDIRETPARRIAREWLSRMESPHMLAYFDPEFDAAHAYYRGPPALRVELDHGGQRIVPGLSRESFERLLSGAVPTCTMILCDHAYFSEVGVYDSALAGDSIVVDMVNALSHVDDDRVFSWGIGSKNDAQHGDGA